ncbi:hypothetical protein [Nocardia sp. CA-145437]|uniref:hypothetical protein n=1 Tax=Nocardia sp. CA-145437 TaxID=3239980 RepID=UPI003D98E7FE
MGPARQTTLQPEQSGFSAAREAERAAEEERNALAAHTVAGHSLDAEDCAYLLRMLGLTVTPATDTLGSGDPIPDIAP